MVIKRKKLLALSLVCMLVFSAILFAYLLGRQDYVPPSEPTPSAPTENGGNDMELTQEQYQLVKDSILPVSFDDMNAVERKNAWIILNAMREIGFIENRSQGESGVSVATWILEMLDLGAISDFTIVHYDNDVGYGVAGHFIASFISENGGIYYLWYNQTWGLSAVTKGDRYGEAVYDRIFHTIVDGEIREREYPRGSAIVEPQD